jgi:tetratricopeptide (TPR) repeat protein
MRRFLTISALLGLAACAGTPQGRYEGLGSYHRKIKTTSPEAQAFFDQGLIFLYGFNHDEAIRSFERAAAADPSCAMAYWGISVANGPHINNPAVDEAHAKAAWLALGRARASASDPVEKELIEALSKRYADSQPADRAFLDRAYADAMRSVWKSHPRDADIGALFAESLMDLRPWDLWTVDGAPQPGTAEIVQVLESVMAQNGEHPLALHLYIHAVEASPEPGKADVAAERLRDLVPGVGHLVHMPSHIDVRRGRWQEAVVANRKAIAADDAYARRAPPPGFYRIYMAHNRHMFTFAAMMQGNRREAMDMAREMMGAFPEEWLKAMAPLVDGFLATPYHLHLRFGQWNEMLAEPEPREIFPIARALRHYARGVALAALKRPEEARTEQKAFREARTRVPKDATFDNNTAADLLAIAEASLEGEILYREGKSTEAFASLREAVKKNDQIRYAEPPDWIQPVRHTLGAALLDAGAAPEAEAVYLEDLKRWPENVWSLAGLVQSLRAQGKKPGEADARLRRAAQVADVDLSSSCLCLPGRKLESK